MHQDGGDGGGGGGADAYVTYFKTILWFSICFLTISSGSLMQILPGREDIEAHADMAILKTCIFFSFMSVVSSIILMFYTAYFIRFIRQTIGTVERHIATIIFIIAVVLVELTTFLFMPLLRKIYAVLAIVPLLSLGIIVLIIRGRCPTDQTHGGAESSEADVSKLLNLSSFVTTLTSGGITNTIIAYLKSLSRLGGHRSHLEWSIVFLFFNNMTGFSAMLLVLVLSILHYSTDRRRLLMAIANFLTYASFILLALSTLLVASESLGLPYLFLPVLFAGFVVLSYLLQPRQEPVQANEVAELPDMWTSIATFVFGLLTVVHTLNLGSEASAIKSFMFLCVSAFICTQGHMLLAVFRPPNEEKFTFCLVAVLLVAALFNALFIEM